MSDPIELVRARRQSVRILLAVWVPLFFAAAVGALWLLDVGPFGSSQSCGSSSKVSDREVSRPGWGALGNAPLPTVRASVKVWTGDELVVFGGDAGVLRQACLTDDGAAYDPVRGTWRKISDPPFDAPYQAQGLMTSSGVLVSGRPCSSQHESPDASVPGCEPGGVAGGIYDPVRDRWETISFHDKAFEGLDLDDVMPSIVGWDGDQAVFQTPDRLLAYKPATRRWERWPLPPTSFRDGLCVAHGALVAVDIFRPDIIVDDVEARDDTSPIATVSRNGAAWSPPVSSGTGVGQSPAPEAVCAGESVLVVETRFDVSAARWMPASPPPSEIGWPQQRQMVWTGEKLVGVDHNAIATYEPSTDTWAVVGKTDEPRSWGAVWVGDALVYEVASTDGNDTHLVAVGVSA